MRVFGICAVLLTLLLVAPAQAVQIPVPTESDSRVRYVDYDPDNVVQIIAVPGRQTFVMFAAEEQIEDLGTGFSDAWEIGPLKRRNGFFIKPKLQDGDTNLTVVTSHRSYTFDLLMRKEQEIPASKLGAKNIQKKLPENFSYVIKFRYPEDEARGQTRGAERRGVDSLLATASRRKYKNLDYWIQGPKTLSPTAAWDDGLFTYLRFAPNTGIPAVYSIDADGKENLVNSHIENDALVIQQVAKKLILRRDGLVAAIFNESYDTYGVENESKTVSPKVKRTIRDGAPETDTQQPPEPPIVPVTVKPDRESTAPANSKTKAGKR